MLRFVLLVALALVPAAARAHFADLCPEQDHCTTDDQCNDGDPCTRDFCDPLPDAAGGCCEHEPVVPCVDTFLCLEASPGQSAPRPASLPAIRVTDPFEDLSFSVTAARRLCTPVDRDGAGIHNPRADLDGYRIAAAKRAPRARPKSVKAETELGVAVVDVLIGNDVLVPGARDAAAPAALAQSGVDDFKCYDVKPGKGAPPFPKGLRLTLANQLLGASRTFIVTAPVELCAAAELGRDRFRDACAALLCYGVKPADRSPRLASAKTIWLRDRFGLRRVDVAGADVACLPAVVNDRTCAAQGFFCEADADCRTGHCVDGVCCESACDTPCYACVGTATNEAHGLCKPIATPGAVDAVPADLCRGSVGCTSGSCACDGRGTCTAAP